MRQDSGKLVGIVFLIMLIGGIFAGGGISTAYIDGVDYTSDSVEQTYETGQAIITTINSDITYGEYGGGYELLDIQDAEGYTYSDAHMRADNVGVYIVNDDPNGPIGDTNHFISAPDVNTADGESGLRQGDMVNYFETPGEGLLSTVGVNDTGDVHTYYLHHFAENNDGERYFETETVDINTTETPITGTHTSTHGYVIVTTQNTYVMTDTIHETQRMFINNNQIVGIDHENVYAQGGTNDVLRSFNYVNDTQEQLSSPMGAEIERIDYDATTDQLVVDLTSVYSTDGSMLYSQSGYSSVNQSYVHSGLNSVYVSDIDTTNNTVTYVADGITETTTTSANISDRTDVTKTVSNSRTYDVSVTDGTEKSEFNVSVGAYQSNTDMITTSLQYDARADVTHNQPEWSISITYPEMDNSTVAKIITSLDIVLLWFLLLVIVGTLIRDIFDD